MSKLHSDGIDGSKGGGGSMEGTRGWVVVTPQAEFQHVKRIPMSPPPRTYAGLTGPSPSPSSTTATMRAAVLMATMLSTTSNVATGLRLGSSAGARMAAIRPALSLRTTRVNSPMHTRLLSMRGGDSGGGGEKYVPAIKLYYGNMPFWRAEAVRMALFIGGVEFEDVRDAWSSEERREEVASKKTFGALPVMDVDGKVLSQTQAMVTYAGKVTPSHTRAHGHTNTTTCMPHPRRHRRVGSPHPTPRHSPTAPHSPPTTTHHPPPLTTHHPPPTRPPPTQLTGLYPAEDPWSSAKVDEAINGCTDCTSTVGATMRMPDDEKLTARAALIAEGGRLAMHVGGLEKLAKENGGSSGAIEGKELTVADLCVWRLVGWLNGGGLDGLPASWINADTFPALTKLVEMVDSHPKVSQRVSESASESVSQ